MMETYHGYVRTPADAIKLFEACRLGLLPRVQRRLSEKERQSIRSGSVFVWDEREAGMRRWTDGKSWSASRVSGSFLTYREMEGKKVGGYGLVRRGAGKTPDSGRGSDEDRDDGEPDGYRYKIDGLMKQSFSITTSNSQHLHLISYYQRPMHGEPDLMQPTQDTSLRGVIPLKGMYPESSLNEAPMPALTRTPMQQPPVPPQPAPYSTPQHQPHQPPPQSYPPQYAQQGYAWPPSPVATPPYSTPSYSHGHYTVAPPFPQGQQLPPPPPQHYPPQQQPPYAAGPPAPYDRAPLPPPQPAAVVQSKTSMPASQPYPPYSAHYMSEPRTASVESPRAQHLQIQAREATMIDPRLGPSSSRDIQGPLPIPNHSGLLSGTPPPRGSVSPPRSAHSDVNSQSGNKASLSALLHHPTPSSSEPNSANPGMNSAGSSPRTATGATPLNSATTMGSAPQSRLAYVPIEDKRAIQSLDKKFCV